MTNIFLTGKKGISKTNEWLRSSEHLLFSLVSNTKLIQSYQNYIFIKSSVFGLQEDEIKLLIHHFLIKSYPKKRFSSQEITNIISKIGNGKGTKNIFQYQEQAIFYSWGLIGPCLFNVNTMENKYQNLENIPITINIPFKRYGYSLVLKKIENQLTLKDLSSLLLKFKSNIEIKEIFISSKLKLKIQLNNCHKSLKKVISEKKIAYQFRKGGDVIIENNTKEVIGFLPSNLYKVMKPFIENSNVINSIISDNHKIGNYSYGIFSF